MPDYVIYAIEALVFIVHVSGFALAAHAVMRVRTSQGAIAWAIGLVTFPWLSIPAYLVLGRSKFQGYVAARRSGTLKINHVAQDLWHKLADYHTTVTPHGAQHRRVMESLARMPSTGANRATVLVDGKETFDAIFAAIESAKKYVLVQFFIIHDDTLGMELQKRLIGKALDGLAVCLLYDEVGCKYLPSSYLDDLRSAGVEVSAFNSMRGIRNRFQINFRNHRKIVIVDGLIALCGGLNAGDEYMGLSRKFGPWRDTHLSLEGPSVLCVQLVFLEDWFWATGKVPELNWTPTEAVGSDQRVLVLASGPADDFDTCDLFFTYMIHAAEKRLWITSPYFVPDDSIVDALQLAALRGVDVRIMLPQKPDHLLVYLSAFSYLEEMAKAGVKVMRYLPGFMHQKVIIVDDRVAAVGTANLDNRSFRLNFELTVLVADEKFTREVDTMLARDFANCREAGIEDLNRRSIFFRVMVRVARLLSPIQ